MKYTLILILACTPLVALTASSFVGLFGTRGTVPGPRSLDVRSATQARTVSAQRVAKDLALSGQLTDTGLLDMRPVELGSAETPSLKSVADAWRRSVAARSLLAKYADLVSLPPSQSQSPQDPRQVAEQLRSRLRDFIAAQRDMWERNLPGADKLKNLLEARIEQLNRQIEQNEFRAVSAAAMSQARDLLSGGRYRECLELLEQEPLAKVRDRQMLTQLDALRRQARYHVDWSALQARSESGDADRGLLSALGQFLAMYKAPPTPAEAALHQQATKWHSTLEIDLSLADLSRVSELETALAEAARIAALPSLDRTRKDRLRAQVARLLDKALPTKEPPTDLLGKQEAVTKSGQRKIGVFSLPSGAEQWRFWRQRQSREERPRGDEQIGRGSLAAPPAVPKYVQWAQTYNERKERLIRDGGSRRAWQDFARWCYQAEQELAAYRRQWGIEEEADRSCRDWSFRQPSALVEQLLAHWDQYSLVLGK